MVESEPYFSLLPAMLVALPITGSLLVHYLGRRSEKIRDWFSIAIAAVTFLGSVRLGLAVASHHRVFYEIPFMVGKLTFAVDQFGMLFAMFTSFVWVLSTLYAADYLSHEHKRDRYHAYNLATLGANMGVVLAGDLVTLYLFFEALGLLAYWMVVHTETAEAKKASIKYLSMTIAGGMTLLAGIFLVYGLGSTGVIEPISLKAGSEVTRWAAAGLMIIGFGVKAGMVPVHVWLPDAHPVAPSPASALLSGVMIKAGAYGIFRTVTGLFRPPIMETIPHHMWRFSGILGLTVLWAGIVTMFVGVVLALLQENSKRMLAYHSVSQMGFILAGIGTAGYLAGHGAIGIAGGLYHIVNHALFKSCLFLGIGAVFFRTGELNMYRLGGLWRKMPLTFLFTTIAACGISGVPLFNGFVSKCLIHHAIVESRDLHGLVSLQAAEIVYIITCGGTVCSFIKLIRFVFLGKPKSRYPEVREAPPRMLVAMGVLAAAIVGFGLVPGVLLEGAIGPGLHAWGLHSEALKGIVIFNAGNLMSVLYAFTIGGALFVIGSRYGLFHLRVPPMLSIDHWYQVGGKGLLGLFKTMAHAYDLLLARISGGLRTMGRRYLLTVSRGREIWRRLVLTMLAGAPYLRRRRCLDHAYTLLDRERRETIRSVTMASLRQDRSMTGLNKTERRAYQSAVREMADHIATRLFKERLAVVSDLAQIRSTDEVEAVVDLSSADLPKLRPAITVDVLKLATLRLEGKSAIKETSAAINALLGKERYDLRLRHLLSEMISPQPAMPVELPAGQKPRVIAGAVRWAAAERLAKWIMDITRILIEVATEERVPWMIEERVGKSSIKATRQAIKYYVRDTGLNVSVIWIVFLVLVLSVILGL